MLDSRYGGMTPEQFEGAKFLAGRRVAMLADRVGFGKSAQFVRAVDYLNPRAVTIICPPVLRSNEVAEFDKWSIFGPGAYNFTILRKEKDDVPAEGVVVASYALAQRPAMAAKLAKRKCDVLILDEAHAVKAPGSERTKAIFRAKGVASAADRVWFVTGTPTPNNASEAYVFARCAGAWGGTYRQFCERYCVEIDTDYGPRIVGNRNEAEFLAMLAPYVLGRNRGDPGRAPLEIDEVAVDGAVPKFEGVAAHELAAIEAAAAAGDWALLSGQAVSTVRRLIGAAKSGPAAELIASEMDGGVGKALVFCSYTATVDGISTALRKYGVAVIDGRTPAAKRDQILSEFQNGDTVKVLVCHYRAAGEGLTLTAANRVYLVEPSWNPEDNTQCIARAWRRGQTQPVRASYVYLPGSLDEQVSRVLSRKVAENAKIQLSRSV